MYLITTTNEQAQVIKQEVEHFTRVSSAYLGDISSIDEINSKFYVKIFNGFDLRPYADLETAEELPTTVIIKTSIEKTKTLEVAGRDFVTNMIGQIRAGNGTGSSDMTAEQALGLFKLLGWTRACLKQGMFPEAYLEFRKECEPVLGQMGQSDISSALKLGIKQVGMKYGLLESSFDDVDVLLDSQGQ